MSLAELKKELEKIPKYKSFECLVASPRTYEEWFKSFKKKVDQFEAEIRQEYQWWKQHVEIDKECGYPISDEMRSFLKFMKKILGINGE